MKFDCVYSKALTPQKFTAGAMQKNGPFKIKNLKTN